MELVDVHPTAELSELAQGKEQSLEVIRLMSYYSLVSIWWSSQLSELVYLFLPHNTYIELNYKVF